MTDSPEARARRQIRRPVLLTALAAWLTLLWLHRPASRGFVVRDWAAVAIGHGSRPAAHAFICALPVRNGSVVSSRSSASAFVSGWLLMLLAMMGPLLTPALLHVTARTLPRRRARAVVALVASYTGAWLAGAVVLVTVAAVAAQLLHTWALLTVVGSIALIWQCSPARQHCSNRHHLKPPLGAFGRRADLDVLKFGLTHGAWCVGTCWNFMLLPLVAGSWHLPMMAFVSVMMWVDRFEPSRPPAWRIRIPLRGLRTLGASSRDALPGWSLKSLVRV